jgi:hypothetical protein
MMENKRSALLEKERAAAFCDLWPLAPLTRVPFPYSQMNKEGIKQSSRGPTDKAMLKKKKFPKASRSTEKESDGSVGANRHRRNVC